MNPTFWRRWCQSILKADPSRPLVRRQYHRRPLGLTTLEDRVTPTLTPQMVLDINPGPSHSNPSYMVAIGSTTYFNADDGANGRELWKSDGTVAGTVLVDPGAPPWSNPYFITNVNGTLFFSGIDVAQGWELWKSDGTAAGTTLVNDIWPGGRGSYPDKLTNVDGTLFFSVEDSTHGRELWKSDGTAAGTTLVKDIWPGSDHSYPGQITNVNGTLFFTADDGAHGRELWKSDGTAGGTVLVKDIYPGIGNTGPRELTNVNGTLFFNADDGANGRELWKSDGTVAGTVLVDPGAPPWSNPYFITNVNGTLFFSGIDVAQGWELWKSDGTAAGTTLVNDIWPGGRGSYPDKLTNVDGTLFFSVEDSTHGRELWKSDGTAAGTTLVKDIWPGSDHSYPGQITNVNGTLFFTAYDGSANGTLQIWQSDGTTAGTAPVANLVAGSLTNVNDKLFFAADNGTHGQELWTLVEGDTPAITIGDVVVTEGHAGEVTATLTIRLSGPTDLPVAVGFATTDGSATAGADYRAASGLLAFSPGQTSKTISVVVTGDRLPEEHETFFVDLGGAINATIVDAQGVGTIREDEPAIRIKGVSRPEGGPNRVTLFEFTVRLSVPYDLPVTVSFRTADGTARAADGDYVARTGTVTFAPGETVQTIAIEVRNDRDREADETFTVELFGNSAYTRLVDPTGLGTILNDD